MSLGLNNGLNMNALGMNNQFGLLGMNPLNFNNIASMSQLNSLQNNSQLLALQQ